MKTEVGEQRKTIITLKRQISSMLSEEFPPLPSRPTKPPSPNSALSPATLSMVTSNQEKRVHSANTQTTPDIKYSAVSQCPQHPATRTPQSVQQPRMTSPQMNSERPSSSDHPWPRPHCAAPGPKTTSPTDHPQPHPLGAAPGPKFTSPAASPAVKEQLPSYSIPVHNRFQLPQPAPAQAKAIPVQVTTRQTAAPSQTLEEAEISPQTDYLIIGDYTLHEIDQFKMNTGEFSSVQKISVSSLKMTDVLHWLHSFHPIPQITRLVLHVGTNACKGGDVTTEQWKALLVKCTTTFPAATVIVSSILPAFGRHNINPIIARSNQNLHGVCTELNLLFVNNRASFVAKSGAPKKEMYKDTLYPSHSGLLKLALNIKYCNSHSTTYWQRSRCSLTPEYPQTSYQHPYLHPKSPPSTSKTPRTSAQYAQFSQQSNTTKITREANQGCPRSDPVKKTEPANHSDVTSPSPNTPLQAIAEAVRLLQAVCEFTNQQATKP
ncbi:hypothetical protein ACOMHN_022114 [Nucella lapillus]